MVWLGYIHSNSSREKGGGRPKKRLRYAMPYESLGSKKKSKNTESDASFTGHGADDDVCSHHLAKSPATASEWQIRILHPSSRCSSRRPLGVEGPLFVRLTAASSGSGKQSLECSSASSLVVAFRWFVDEEGREVGVGGEYSMLGLLCPSSSGRDSSDGLRRCVRLRNRPYRDEGRVDEGLLGGLSKEGV